jgi:hypothetical protein
MLVRFSDVLWAIDTFQLDATHLGFVLLDVDHFLDGLSQVEFLYDFSELASVDLGEVKEIFHEEVHHTGR